MTYAHKLLFHKLSLYLYFSLHLKQNFSFKIHKYSKLTIHEEIVIMIEEYHNTATLSLFMSILIADSIGGESSKKKWSFLN